METTIAFASTEVRSAPTKIKGRGNRPGRADVLRRLTEIKESGSIAWHLVGTWPVPATASKVARGITNANTPQQKPGDVKCPPGRWEAGFEEVDHGADVIVRYLGDSEDDPFE